MIGALLMTMLLIAGLGYLWQRSLKHSIGVVMLGWMLAIAFFAGLWAAVFLWSVMLK